MTDIMTAMLSFFSGSEGTNNPIKSFTHLTHTDHICMENFQSKVELSTLRAWDHLYHVYPVFSLHDYPVEDLKDYEDRELGIVLFLEFSVSVFFLFFTRFSRCFTWFFVTFRLCYKFLLGIQTVRGPQELSSELGLSPNLEKIPVNEDPKD